MADCLKSNLPVQEPEYCEDASGNIIPGSAVYSWMSVRAAGPNVLKNNKFCGENKFLDDVQIDGDLNVDGTISGNVVVTPPYQAQIDCIEIDANQTGDTFDGTQKNNWDPTSSGYSNLTTTIIVRVSQTTNLTGLVNRGQCYVVLISPPSNNGNIRILSQDAGSSPENQFITGPSVPNLQPGEAINLFYSHTLQKFALVSHL